MQPFACLLELSYDKEKKRRKAWGEEFRFYSYMPPFFFDFFFLAFVGLFTRLNIHNGLCLRILLFFRKPILSNRFSGADHSSSDLEFCGRIFFPWILRYCTSSSLP